MAYIMDVLTTVAGCLYFFGLGLFVLLVDWVAHIHPILFLRVKFQNLSLRKQNIGGYPILEGLVPMVSESQNI